MSELLMSAGGIIGVIVLIVGAFLLTRYKRCPSNKILVIYGKVGKGKSAKCVHGGGAFIIPIIQSWQFLHLSPLAIEIDLRGALSKQNIRINTPSTFTVAISTRPEIMLNAAERLLGLPVDEIKSQAVDIILGQLRLVIATLTIEEINQDREKFLQNINKNVALELNRIGLDLINVNIKDITDESDYIESIGKKAAAEAVNNARVEVAQQERSGAIGEAKATREKEVEVARENAEAEEGRKRADSKKRIALAELETEASIGESKFNRSREVQVAQEEAEAEKGRKDAESKTRISVAGLEADAVEGENLSNAKVAESEATLAEKKAEARRRSDTAKAIAEKEILQAQKEAEQAKLEKEEIVRREIEKRKEEIRAEAEAERIRRVARGEADATRMRFEAEAEGMRKLLESKADGYKEILEACGNDSSAAATLLLLEKLETLVEKQTDAIRNLEIDKITVWEGGGQNGESSTSNFIRNFINTMPPIHELAKQVGIDLPSYLGSINFDEESTKQKLQGLTQAPEKSDESEE